MPGGTGGQSLKDLFPPAGQRATAEHNERVDKAIADAVNGQYPGGLHVDDAGGGHIGGGPDSSPLMPQGHLEIGGTIKDADGKEVGYFRRIVSQELDEDDGTLHWGAYHDSLYLNDEATQGAGFARAFNANLYDWYRRSGVEYVDANVGGTSGGYAWPSQGYDFRNRAGLDSFLLDGNGMSDPTQAPGYTAAAYAEQAPLLADAKRRAEAGEWVSGYEISQLGRKAGQGKNDWWLGKALLLGGGFLGRLYM